MRSLSFFPIVLVALLFAGCIGTDLVDEQPGFEPRIAVSVEQVALLAGQQQALTATFYDDRGMAQPTTPIQWQVANTTIANVDAGGQVTALASGQTQLTAKVGSVESDPVLLTVVASLDDAARIDISPATSTLSQGQSQTLTAAAFNLNNTALTGVTFTWASDAPSVATVDASGRVQAVAPGNAGITATANGISSMVADITVLGRSRTGRFQRNAGTSYNLEGTAVLQEGSNGNLTLRFSDDFSTDNGPSLFVYLSNSSTLSASSVQIDNLQRINGAQSYSIPNNIDLEDFDFVLIHCVPFNVTFGAARLQ